MARRIRTYATPQAEIYAEADALARLLSGNINVAPDPDIVQMIEDAIMVGFRLGQQNPELVILPKSELEEN